MRVERMLLLLFPAACCAAGELLAPLPPDGSLDDCGVSVGWLTLGDWLILGAVPTMQVRLAVDLSSSPYRLGRDVLVEMQARDAAGTNAPLAKGAAWLQQEERCASDASLPGCSELLIEMTTWREVRVRPAFVNASTGSALSHSRLRGTVALHECLDSMRAGRGLSEHYGEVRKFYGAAVKGSKLAAPLNLPRMVSSTPNETNAVASFVPSAEHPTQLRLRRPSVWMEDWIFEKDPWMDSGQKITPLWHLPFFSNCEAFDGRISIEQALEDAERCNLVAPEDTIPINEFNWGATERYSDTCDYVLRCAYEEDHRDLREHVQPPVWPRASDRDTAFYLTMTPSTLEAAQCRDDCDKLEEMFLSQDLRFVRVRHSEERPDGAFVPRHVELDVKYWQRTALTKEAIDTNMRFSGWSEVPKGDDEAADVDIGGVPPPCDCQPQVDPATGEPPPSQKFWIKCGPAPSDDYADDERRHSSPSACAYNASAWPHWRAYTLRIRFVPVDWYAVVNAFALAPMTYIICFFIISGGGITTAALIWAASACLARVRRPGERPAPLNLRFWLRYACEPYKAASMVFFPLAVSCVLVRFVVADMDPFGGLPHGNFFHDGEATEEQMRRLSYGKIGLGLLVIGAYMTRCAILLWAPGSQGARGPLWRSTALLIVFCTIVLNLSQSSVLRGHAFAVAISLKVLILLGEPLLVHASANQAMAMQCVVLEVALLLFFLGADGFIDFVSLTILEFFLNIGKRYVLEPLKWSCWGKRKLSMLGISDAVTAARERDVANKVEGALPDGATEVMVVWTIEFSAQMIETLVIAVIFIFKREFDVTEVYGIRELDLLFFMLFAIVVGPAEFICDIFLLNAAERLHGWDVVAYMKRLRGRFEERRHQWVLLEPAPLPPPRSVQTPPPPPPPQQQQQSREPDTQPDDLAAGAWTTIEQLAFSSQMWFLVMAYGLGVILVALGAVLVGRLEYNPFTDLWSAPYVSIIWLFLHVLRCAALRVAAVFKIWDVRAKEGGNAPERARSGAAGPESDAGELCA